MPCVYLLQIEKDASFPSIYILFRRLFFLSVWLTETEMVT